VIQRRFVLSVLAAVVAILPASGQESDLTWKFTKDKTFYQEMTTTTEQKMKVQGTDVEQKQTQTFYFSWTPVDPIDEKAGTVTLKQKIIGLKMNIDIGGSKINYDSTATDAAGGAANPLHRFFEALKEAEFKLTLDTKKMKVTGITGHDEFVKKLSDANPQMKPLLDKILSKQALQDMSTPLFAAMPGEKKKKGDSWGKDDPIKLDMGPIGSYTTTFTYTYEGPDKDKVEHVTVKTELKYEAPKDPAGGLPFRIKSAELKSKDGTGDVVVDLQANTVKSSKIKMTLTGNLTIEIGQQSTSVDLTQDQTTEIKISEKNPIEKK
jgi:hypothetical protein